MFKRNKEINTFKGLVMAQKFDKYNFTISSVCHCECHKPGVVIRHCMPCCDLTYKTYLDKDSKLIVEEYIRLKENK